MMALWFGDIPIHLAPLDVVLVSGPLALAMLAVELLSYWRFGRVPESMSGRRTVAMALAAVLGPACLAAVWYWRPAALLIIGALLVLWVSHSYRRTTAPISPRVRWLCVAIRVVVVLLLLAYLLRPTLRRIEVLYEKATLFVLYDASKSMTIADAGPAGRQARIDAVRQAFESRSSQLAGLARLFDLRQFMFDETLGRAVEQPADLAGVPRGESTAIGTAIQQAYQAVPGKKVAGFIVVTDGANNLAGPGTDPLQVAAGLARQSDPVAFWPVGVGRETVATDRPMVVIKSLSLAERRVPAFNVLPVHAVFEVLNLAGQPVTVELVFGQGSGAKVVDSEVITAAASKNADTISADLEVTPTTTGFHAVTVQLAEGQQAKGALLSTEHSRMTDYVQVVDDLIQVFYVEGKFRSEAQYLIQALAGSDLMRLNRQFILTSAALGGAEGQRPRSEAEWRRYHVIILGDVKADTFTAEDLRTIRGMVRDLGKGLLMLGGRDSFGQGGWPDSPLADVMPFDLRQATGQLTVPFKLTPTGQGLAHQLMQLEEDRARNSQVWANIPTIQGANRFPDARQIQTTHPGAIILAASQGGQPVMVAQQAGKGRVLAMAIDTTWRWRLHLDTGRELHNRFWRQAVLWLANRQGNVWVTTDQPRYRLSQVRGSAVGSPDRQRVIVRAGMEDQTGKPVRDPKATLTEALPPDAQGKGQDISIPLGPQVYRQDHFELELPPPTREGNYRLVFEGTLDGKPVKAETNFLVEATDVELSRPLANFDLLRQMAAAASDLAGGRFYTLDQLDELLSRFKSSDYLVRREERRTTNLADKLRWPILLGVFIGLLAEWVIRKWNTLV